MKINSVRIAGFRGFNEEHEINFNKKLTIVFGPNSYGKTSISEALEWLLFGVTSKVDVHTSGKNEFKGTYRNIHFPSDSIPFVESSITQSNGESVLIRGELGNDDSISKFYNGILVHDWPWETPELRPYSPFILQHALQDLLQTSPSDRYSRFSKLLGTQLLDYFQDIFNSLATKYNPPTEIQFFLKDVEKFLSGLNSEIYTKFLKAIEGNSIRKAIVILNKMVLECLGEPNTTAVDEYGNISIDVLDHLVTTRRDEVNAFFNKEISLQNISIEEKEYFDSTHKSIALYISKELISEYLEYAKLQTQAEYIKQAEFFRIGLEIFRNSPDFCPFCGTSITGGLSAQINTKHEEICEKIAAYKELIITKKRFLEDLAEFKKKIENFYLNINKKVENLSAINNEEDKTRILEIFGESSFPSSDQLITIMESINQTLNQFSRTKDLTIEAVQDIELSFEKCNQSTQHLTKLGDAVFAYIAAGQELIGRISTNFNSYSQAVESFEKRLNAKAGTQNLSILISVLKQFPKIKKYMMIKQAITSMKELREKVTEYVAEKTRSMVDNQLTDDVMHWYDQIRTEGDPDVHFSGFSLGGSKARHEISVSAKSYGHELVSAVSSLSESKLNALGLSIKIANNVKDGIPFGFLVIDDPVQSLDGDHSEKISIVIRKLVEDHGKQIILLSHNETWLKQLLSGTQSINGSYYEITGFGVSGPMLSSQEWKPWLRRLNDIVAICNNNAATQVELQRAEEEIRLAICDITSRVYNKKTGKSRSANNLNETRIRSMLIESGIETKLVDRISQTFTTTDDSHHSGENYTANKERIKQYHSWVKQLSKILKESEI